MNVTVILGLFLGSRELDHLLAGYGYPIVFLLVGAESIGIPVPGETTLALAAIYAGVTGKLSITVVIVLAATGAILGDNIGYGIGRAGGYPFLRRYGRYVRITEQRLMIGRYLFARYGGKVVFLGRFVPILRTYVAFLAGTSQMRWPRFLFFNAAGGVVWASAYGTAYYYFGDTLERLQAPADIAIGAVALVLLVAGLVQLRRKESQLASAAGACLTEG
jgi:membrane protein DedA with SNARE-associated domain